MGKLGITGVREPLATAGGEALRSAMVDSAAIVRLLGRGFEIEVRPGGRIVGKAGPKLVRR